MLLTTQIQYIKDKSQKSPSYVQFTYTYINISMEFRTIFISSKYDNQQDNQNG